MDNVAELLRTKLRLLEDMVRMTKDKDNYGYLEYSVLLNRVNKLLGEHEPKASRFTFLKRSPDEFPKHDGFYFRRRYSGSELSEFKNGDWVDDKGFMTFDGIFEAYPPEPWWDMVEI